MALGCSAAWTGGNIDKEWAVEHMKKIAAHFWTDLCDFTLTNVPYECVKRIPTDSMTILALANNNAALVYTVFAIALGLFLKALTKLRIDPGGNIPPREVGPKVHWVRKLPLPASLFYDEPAELDFIDNELVIGVSTFAVVSVAAACFAVFWGYYAGDEHDQLDVRFGSQWNVTGYECAPLQFEEEWGTNLSYSKCLTSLRPIEADVSVIFEDSTAKQSIFHSSLPPKASVGSPGARSPNRNLSLRQIFAPDVTAFRSGTQVPTPMATPAAISIGSRPSTKLDPRASIYPPMLALG